MFLHDLLNFKHVFPSQLQQVVHPVSGGCFKDRTPDQGPGLESEKYPQLQDDDSYLEDIESPEVKFSSQLLRFATDFLQ